MKYIQHAHRSFSIYLLFLFHIPSYSCMDRTEQHNQTSEPLVGIAACSATYTASSIVALTKRLHPDFIELKTIRRVFHPGHPSPLIAPVSIPFERQISPIHFENVGETDIVGTFYPGKRLEDSPQIALANSIGLPSASLEENKERIRKIQTSLSDYFKKPPKLILSVYGDYYDDFKSLARVGHELNVPYVCANLSCPNIESTLPIYKDPSIVRAILTTMKKKLPSTQLIAKIGAFRTDELPLMETILCTIAQAGAQGVYGINSVPIIFLNQKGEPFFGENRRQCGLSGAPIRNLALVFTQQAREIIDKHNLDLKLFACGGVTDHTHVAEFAQKGADVVMSATGATYNSEFSFKPKSKL